jgi:GNAT superfamily N-acetyltransferase
MIDRVRDSLILTTELHRMDVLAIHSFLSNESYWAAGIPLETVRRSMEHSLCFGVLDGVRQAAFARVITDRATFAYLCDVYVEPDYRGLGLATWLLEAIDAHPELQGLRRWNLVTRDAHPLYAKFGFHAPANPAGYMERRDPDVYLAPPPPRA